jgi:SAM-dependent methyltransferase
VSVLSHLNIKYVILAEDTLSEGPKFNLTNIRDFLSNNPKIEFVKRFGKHLLYQLKGTPRMFFATTKTMYIGSEAYSSEIPADGGWILEPAQILQHRFYENPDVFMSLSPDKTSLGIVYNYGQERIIRVKNDALWIATMQTYGELPFDIKSGYGWLLLTVKTQEGVALQLGVLSGDGDFQQWSQSLGPFLSPLNPNDESRARPQLMVSTDEYYTFIFNVPFQISDQLFVKFALRPFDFTTANNYTVSVKRMGFVPLNESNVIVDNHLAEMSYQDDNLRVAEVCNNPASFLINVTDARAPFVLVSSMLYDNGWVATVNGKEAQLIKVELFPYLLVNGWLINQSGSFQISIGYGPQVVVNDLLLISGGFILGITMLLFFIIGSNFWRKVRCMGSLINGQMRSFNSCLGNLISRARDEFCFSADGEVWGDFVSSHLNHSNESIKRFYTELPKKCTIVDLGCGDGATLFDILTQKPCETYGVGIDISSKSLKEGVIRSKMLYSKICIDFVRADLSHLPLLAKSCDGILIKNVLHHLPSLDCLSQIQSIARDGTLLLVIDLAGVNPFKFIGRKLARFINIRALGEGKDFLFYTPRTLKLFLLRSGFQVIDLKNRDFFFRIFGVILLLLPPLRRFISKRSLFALYRIERTIETKEWLGVFASCVILHCIRQQN